MKLNGIPFITPDKTHTIVRVNTIDDIQRIYRPDVETLHWNLDIPPPSVIPKSVTVLHCNSIKSFLADTVFPQGLKRLFCPQVVMLPDNLPDSITHLYCDSIVTFPRHMPAQLELLSARSVTTEIPFTTEPLLQTEFKAEHLKTVYLGALQDHLLRLPMPYRLYVCGPKSETQE